MSNTFKLTPTQRGYINLLVKDFPNQFSKEELIKYLKKIVKPQGRTKYLQNIVNIMMATQETHISNVEKVIRPFKINFDMILKKGKSSEMNFNEKTFQLESAKIKIFQWDGNKKREKFDYSKDLVSFQQIILTYIKSGKVNNIEDIDLSSFKEIYGDQVYTFLKMQASLLFEASSMFKNKLLDKSPSKFEIVSK